MLLALAVLSACRPEPRGGESEAQRGALPSVSAAPSAKPPEASPRPDAAPLAVAPTVLTATAAPRPEASARRPTRVVVLGDSLSDPRVHGGHYLEGLTACPGVRVENFAKGGFMVNQMRRRFEKEVLPKLTKQHTDLIVFGGVNDLYSDETAGRSVEKISADLGRIYDAAKAAQLRVIAITVAPWGGFTRYYNERRARATARLNAWIWQQRESGRVDAVIDAASLLACGDAERLCPAYEPPFHDGLHFGRLGHQRLGQALLEGAFDPCRPRAQG